MMPSLIMEACYRAWAKIICSLNLNVESSVFCANQEAIAGIGAFPNNDWIAELRACIKIDPGFNGH